MRSLRLGLAQLNPTVGDLDGNFERIVAAIGRARAQGVELLTFPELAITGYPPEDLLLNPSFVERAVQRTRDLVPHSAGMTLVVGTVEREAELFDAAAVLHDGRWAGTYHKHHLPNYGVFDEKRYFAPGRGNAVFVRDGVTFGVSICEDIWFPGGPIEEQAGRGGAEVLLNLSASPYHAGKAGERRRMLRTRAMDNRAIIAYVNLVGGQDEVLHDGASLLLGPQGEVLAEGAMFEEDLIVADLDLDAVSDARQRGLRGRRSGGQLDARQRPGRRRGVSPGGRDRIQVEVGDDQVLVEHRALGHGLALRAEDQARAVVEHLVLAAHQVHVGDDREVVGRAGAKHAPALAGLARVVGRGRQVEQDLGAAVARLRFDRSVREPDVLADADAERDAIAHEYGVPAARREVAFLVEDAVVGQQMLAVDAGPAAVVQHRGRVEQLRLALHSAHDQRHAGRVGDEVAGALHGPLDERGAEQQVLGRVARDRQLGEGQHLHAQRAGAPDGGDDPLEVAVEVADRRVQLGQAESQGAHRAAIVGGRARGRKKADPTKTPGGNPGDPVCSQAGSRPRRPRGKQGGGA